jgi:hypothetical protein
MVGSKQHVKNYLQLANFDRWVGVEVQWSAWNNAVLIQLPWGLYFTLISLEQRGAEMNLREALWGNGSLLIPKRLGHRFGSVSEAYVMHT